MAEKKGVNVIEIAEQLRELWDNRENVHARLIDLAQSIEMYGEVGEDEKQTLLRLKHESEEMTEALTALCREAWNVV